MSKEWQRFQDMEKKSTRNKVDDEWYTFWDKIIPMDDSESKLYGDTIDVTSVDDLQYYENSMDELLKVEQKIQERTKKYQKIYQS